MSVNDILDTLDELIDKSWNLPLSGGRCVVDAERILQLTDEIRRNMPEEIKQAQMIVEDRRAIIEQAKKEAEQTIRRAEERARTLVCQEEIYQQAQKEANEMLNTSNARAKEIRLAASDYADGVLKDCEERLNTSLGEIRSTRAQLKSKRGQ